MVSIPQSEFCPLGLHAKRLTPDGLEVSIPQSEFCPLGRRPPVIANISQEMFQFLSRNSVRWDYHPHLSQIDERIGFNSSVGILSVGTRSRRSPRGREAHVSIPQSEFCPLGLLMHAQSPFESATFQFLSRNSVRWDENPMRQAAEVTGVSIPQSEFCPLGLNPPLHAPDRERVSIPQSEFCPLGLGPLGYKALGHIVSIPQSEFCPLGL